MGQQVRGIYYAKYYGWGGGMGKKLRFMENEKGGKEKAKKIA